MNYKSIGVSLIITLYMSLCSLMQASDAGTEITFQFDKSSATTLVIGRYVNGSIFVADSIAVNAEGLAVWRADSLISQGLYEIVLSSDVHHPFLVGEDRQFKVVVASPFSTENIQFDGALESAAYNNYQLFIQKKMKEKKALLALRSTYSENSDSVQVIRQRQRNLDEDVRAYIVTESERFDGYLLASILHLALSPVVPDFSEEAMSSSNPDSTRQNLKFNYVFTHHFDHFDAGDVRLLNTPFYKQHLDHFYTRVCPPVADSVISVSFPLIEAAKKDSSTFKFMVNYVMNYAEKSKVMGMDAVVLKLLQTYYITGEVWWVSHKQKENAKEMEVYLRYNQIGMQAPNFTLPMWQNDGAPFSLYDMPPHYTLLVFWEPDCGHCKTFIPKLYKHLSEAYDTLPFDVLAVSTKADTALHHSFIVDNKLEDWLHLCNDNSNNDFKVYYDLRVVPKVYLLDENKRIVAKQLGIESLDQLIKALDL